MAADRPAWEVAARSVAARYARRLGFDDALQIARLAAWQAEGRWRADGGTTLARWCYIRADGACRDEVRNLSGRRYDTDLVRRVPTTPLESMPDGFDVAELVDLDGRLDAADLLERLGRLAPRAAVEAVALLADGLRLVEAGAVLGVSGSRVCQRRAEMADRMSS